MINKTRLRFSTLLAMITKIQNIVPVVLWYISDKPLSVHFYDGDSISLLADEKKCLPSICKLKRQLGIKASNDEKFLYITVKGVQYALRKDSAFDEISSLNEIWDWDEYQLRSRDLTNKTVVDVGGYFGDTALLFASKCAKVHVFEPFPQAIESIKRNLNLNKHLSDNIVLHPYGLGSEDKTTTIKYNSQKISHADATGDNDGADTAIVHIKNAAEYFSQLDLQHVDILKIDIEGGEYALFSQTDFFDAMLPTEVILEYHNGADTLKQYLNKRNYSTRTVGGKDIGLLFGNREKNS